MATSAMTAAPNPVPLLPVTEPRPLGLARSGELPALLARIFQRAARRWAPALRTRGLGPGSLAAGTWARSAASPVG